MSKEKPTKVWSYVKGNNTKNHVGAPGKKTQYIRPPFNYAEKQKYIKLVRNGLNLVDAAAEMGSNYQRVRATRIQDKDFHRKLLSLEYSSVMEAAIKAAEGYYVHEEVQLPALDDFGNPIYLPDGTQKMRVAKRQKKWIKPCPDILRTWLQESGFNADEIAIYLDDPKRLRDDFLSRLHKLEGDTADKKRLKRVDGDTK